VSERPGQRTLPAILPIFPLTGVLLLPRGQLPLNIFEPRYLAMTRDAMEGDRLIGMVQPQDPHQSLAGNPPVYPNGCAGVVTEFAETQDGRLLITLTGLCRFRIAEELPLLRGYRRVVPDWAVYAADLVGEEDADFDRQRLLRGLKTYFGRNRISANWEALAAVRGERLIVSLAMVCPFAPSEKQALLEAADLGTRARLLTTIVEMAGLGPLTEGGARH
jgi:Lon protease-like protein